MKHVHILGICGTFMGGIAVLAKEQGFHVTGSDAAVYPPMSTQLEQQGIVLKEGYKVNNLNPKPDHIVIGNAMSRGNEEVEAVLSQGFSYQSGPQWLAENILHHKKVLAVSGTHGKTTTSSLLAWILEFAGLKPGFLIGGVPQNMGISARLGNGEFFVIEADEYDSAFFDKRSKFMHYHPHTLILNNLEFDHADIFSDLDAIKTQFQYLLRTVPGNGHIITNGADSHLQDVINRGCWTPVISFGVQDDCDWSAKLHAADGSHFEVLHQGKSLGEIAWSLIGVHNVNNALSAIATAHAIGLTPKQIFAALPHFTGIKRRLEVRGRVNQITVYDDFAHHPTAIATTLHGLRKKVGTARIIAVMEMGSYTMKTGQHGQQVYSALAAADEAFILQPTDANWDIHHEVAKVTHMPTAVFPTVNAIVKELTQKAQQHDHILIMSNKGFDGIHDKILHALEEKFAKEEGAVAL